MAIKVLGKNPNLRFVVFAKHGKSGGNTALSSEGVNENAANQAKLIDRLSSLEPGIQARIFTSSMPKCLGTALQLHERLTKVFSESDHYFSPVHWLDVSRWNDGNPVASTACVLAEIERAFELFSDDDINTIAIVAYEQHLRNLPGGFLDEVGLSDFYHFLSPLGSFKESEMLVIDLMSESAEDRFFKISSEVPEPDPACSASA